MTENTSQPNASIAPLGEDGCRELLSQARVMLHRAWDNPGELGQESEICRDATALHARVRQYASPREKADPTAWTAFEEALRISWMAVWRARDYTALAFAKRSKAENWQTLVTFTPNQDNVRSLDGIDWFDRHYPLCDRDGHPISKPEFSPRQRYAYEAAPSFWEGATLCRAADVPDRSDMLRWAYVKMPLPQRGGGYALPDCLLDHDDQSIDYTGNAFRDLTNAIFLGRVHLTAFDSPDLEALTGARFEAGLDISGVLRRDTGLPNIETGGDLTALNFQCHGSFSIEATCGLKLFQTLNVTIAQSLRFNVQHPVSFAKDPNGSTQVGEFIAEGVTFKRLIMHGIHIMSDFTLAGSTVLEGCSFASMHVGREANLRQLTFRSSASGAGLVSFQNCAVGGRADFSGISSEREIDFSRSNFGGDVQFSGAHFSASANFDGAAFRGDVEFNRLGGRNTTFLGDVNFNGDGTDTPSGRFQRVDFRDAEFLRQASFRNRDFRNDTIFDRATFMFAPSFHGSDLHPMTSFAGVKFLWRRQLRSKMWERMVLSRWRDWRKDSMGDRLGLDIHFLSATAASFRDLTSLARRIDAPDLAYKFHRQELRARTLMPVGGEVSRPESWVGYFYGLFGDFGNSFIRPLAWWALILVSCAWIYNWMAPAAADRADAALTISLAAQTRPFVFLDQSFGKLPEADQASVWPHAGTNAPAAVAPQPGQPESPCKAQGEGRSKVTYACMASHLIAYHDREFKLLATFQSIISIALVFLTVLGLRRKFQAT